MSHDTVISADEIRDSARAFLKGLDRRDPQPDALWRKIVGLGWSQLRTPAALDGLDQPFAVLAALYSEMGRALSPVSLAGSMATLDFLTRFCPERVDLIGAIGSGDLRPAVVVAASSTLGVMRNVPDGAVATHLLLLSTDLPGQVALQALREGDVAPVRSWDRTASLADLAVSGSADILGGSEKARLGAELVRAHLDLALALDSLGGAEQCLEEAVAYMAVREQFGRPIGSFQALKHRAADLKVEIAISRALIGSAVTAYEMQGEDWVVRAVQAKIFSTRTYRKVAEESVQFHGGIGFTWEHTSHLFLKRACLNEVLRGSAGQESDRIAPAIAKRVLAGRV